MTKLEFVNKFFFQWFFVRLTKCQQKVIEDFTLTEVSVMPGGDHSIGGSAKTATYKWYAIQYWIIPTTGWGKPFRQIGYSRKFLNITKAVKLK